MNKSGFKIEKRGKVILLSAVLMIFFLAAAAILFRFERTVHKTFVPAASSDDAVVFELPITARSLPIGAKQSRLVLAEAIYFGPYFVSSNQMVSAKRAVQYHVTNNVLRVTVVEKPIGEWKFQLVLTNVTSLSYRSSDGEGRSVNLRSRMEVWTSQLLRGQ